MSAADLSRISDKLFLRAVARAIKASPAYRKILLERQLDVTSLLTIDAILATFPVLEKKMLFGRFGLDELVCDDFPLEKIASILTSSGHGGGGFAFGLSSVKQLRSSPLMIDLGLDMAFQTDHCASLLINCLPMGVTFQSEAVCVANVSVREDMALAIVDRAGRYFQQIILVGDPLFLKKLTDYANAHNFNWGKFKINVVIGEETFSETFRSYLADNLQINLDNQNDGSIISSMGVAELGLNLLTETRDTVALRRVLASNPVLLSTLFGMSTELNTIPTFFIYSPLRIYVEIIHQDSCGIGDLVVTLLDKEALVPMVRYRTGDRAAFVDVKKCQSLLGDQVNNLNKLALPILALFGRTKDCLPLDTHIDAYKEALYKDCQLAKEFSGAFKLSFRDEYFYWEVQLGKMSSLDSLTAAQLLEKQIDSQTRQTKVTCFPYEKFPYGQTLDYERKFNYWAH